MFNKLLTERGVIAAIKNKRKEDMSDMRRDGEEVRHDDECKHCGGWGEFPGEGRSFEICDACRGSGVDMNVAEHNFCAALNEDEWR
jgi:DnaJ-class molecular chaperone